MSTVRQHFLRQAGVISLAQAREAGMTYRQVEHKVQTAEWLSVRRAVYRLHAAAPLPETDLWAPLLWLGPEALLTEQGAAWWWGLGGRCQTEACCAAPGHAPDVVVVVAERTPLSDSSSAWSGTHPSTCSRRPPFNTTLLEPRAPDCWRFAGLTSGRGGARVRLTRAFVDPRDRHRHRGVPVVSRPWAVLTTAARWERDRPGRGIALIDRAKQTRAVRQPELERAFIRHTGCRGSTTVRTLLLRTGDGAQSELERLAVSLLRGAGITGFRPNLTVRLKDGQPVEIDIAFPERRIAIELDGYAFHSGADAFRTDVRRGNRLMADGWTVRRFTWDDLVGDPDSFVAVVVELLCG